MNSLFVCFIVFVRLNFWASGLDLSMSTLDSLALSASFLHSKLQPRVTTSPAYSTVEGVDYVIAD